MPPPEPKQTLIDRASGSTAGPVIGTVVYGPDYSKARWEQRRYEEEAERKHCDRTPVSILPPPPAAPRPHTMPPVRRPLRIHTACRRSAAGNSSRAHIHRIAGLDARRLIAVLLESREDLVGMRAVARLDRHVEARALRRHVEEQAPVVDLEDVGAELAEPGRDLASTPGRSGMVRRNETMRSSRSSSRTMMEARMRGSILPPHRISPTLRPRKRAGSASMAARPAAPAPSAMVFCRVR